MPDAAPRGRMMSLPLRLVLACWAACLLLLAAVPAAFAGQSPELHGTGFAVAASGEGTLILTALHVVQGRQGLEIGSGEPLQWLPARLLASDAENDLALLSVPAKLPLLPLYEPLSDHGGVPIGAEVHALGYPMPELLGFTPKITSGLINGLAPGTAGETLFQFSAPIHHGSSGSPLLAPDGSVIGMVQATMAPERFRKRSKQLPQLLGYAVNAGILADFLRRSGVITTTLPRDPAAGGSARSLFVKARDSVVPIRASR